MVQTASVLCSLCRKLIALVTSCLLFGAGPVTKPLLGSRSRTVCSGVVMELMTLVEDECGVWWVHHVEKAVRRQLVSKRAGP